jgi:hypothetical protein
MRNISIPVYWICEMFVPLQLRLVAGAADNSFTPSGPAGRQPAHGFVLPVTPGVAPSELVKVKMFPATGTKSVSNGRVPIGTEGEDAWPAKKTSAVPGTVTSTEADKLPAIPKQDNAARTVNLKLVIASSSKQ